MPKESSCVYFYEAHLMLTKSQRQCWLFGCLKTIPFIAQMLYVMERLHMILNFVSPCLM